jgi:hypothetical protein
MVHEQHKFFKNYSLFFFFSKSLWGPRPSMALMWLRHCFCGQGNPMAQVLVRVPPNRLMGIVKPLFWQPSNQPLKGWFDYSLTGHRRWLDHPQIAH